MLSVIVLNVIVLNVIVLNVIVLNVIVLNIVTLSVISVKSRYDYCYYAEYLAERHFSESLFAVC
jgi:hypothetical protein